VHTIRPVWVAITVLLFAAASHTAAQVTSVHIGLVTTDVNHLSKWDAQDEFLTTDPAVQYLVTDSGGRGNKLRIEWWNPRGQNVQHTEWPDSNSSGGPPIWGYWGLPIAGSPHAYDPGEWQVRTYWNDVLVNATKFRISLPPDGPVQVLTPSVFPNGTIGQPYFLQLTARGGTPGYRWTEFKALPAGLTLSPNGIITGTPQEISATRVVIKAEDSAGHSTTRTFGIPISPPAEGYRLLSRSLLEGAGTNTCPADALQGDFAVSDAGITLTARIDGDNPAGDHRMAESPRRSRPAVGWPQDSGGSAVLRQLSGGCGASSSFRSGQLARPAPFAR
jgi:Putative Ig domain